MNKLSQLFSNEISYAIGWTIIHSLWQCTLIALLIAISYAFTKKASASTRYWINSLGLASCFITSCITFYFNYYDSVSIEFVSNEYMADITPSIQQSHLQTISDIINQYINQIAIIWFIGFALYISKYIAEFFYCQHIKSHHYKKTNQQLQQLFNSLKNSLEVTRNIQLRISEIVDVPCVIGHFKPVILLPASLVLGLSIKQIEVILLHELGHVRRNDYLISSLQTLITLFYFFNPCARWISSKMDEERENACDDIAVSVSGDPLFYANTLKEFAEMNNNYSPAVAMTGRKNLLINRIKRLFIRDTSFAKTYGKAITIMAMFLLMIGYSVAGYSEEKKPTTDAFSVKIENEPLSNLVKLVEGYCPNTQGKIKLKHPDQIISGSFPDFECSTIEHAIRGMDDSMDSIGPEVSINADSIPLKDILKTIEASCPNVTGKVVLKNPELKSSLKSEKMLCVTAEGVLRKMDGDIKLNLNQITQIENSLVNDEYRKIVMQNNVYDNSEAIKKGYSAECVATFTSTKSGNASNIVPNCSSTSEDAKNYYNIVITNMIKGSKFPIKMENGKAVAVKNITIRASWRVEQPHPLNLPTTATQPNKQENTENVSTTKNAKQISINEDSKENFSLGLSINKEININNYKEIEFKPILFGKKLIDAKRAFDYTYTLREFDHFNEELIALLNKNFFSSIRKNKLNFLENTSGSKKLIGEVYIHKIIPYWQKELIPFSSSSGNFALGTAELNHFPFKANIMIGIILKDAESKEIVAVLKDQFTYSESKTGVSYMSEKRKSRFVDENIISNITESISKTTNGLIAYSQEKASDIHLVSPAEFTSI